MNMIAMAPRVKLQHRQISKGLVMIAQVPFTHMTYRDRHMFPVKTRFFEGERKKLTVTANTEVDKVKDGANGAPE
jgi:hypothetical protein